MEMMNINSDCQMSQATGDEFAGLAAEKRKALFKWQIK